MSTIAHAVGALLERSQDYAHGLAECEQCGRCYDGITDVCAADQQPLTRTRGTLLINGRYHLECRLGRGGMGTVYAATDIVLERRVAVMVIRRELAGAQDLAARFRREARAAASFAHPHVVRVYDFGIDRTGHPFLVMELLEGSTLRERLAANGRIETCEVLQVLRGVCSAVSAAHSRGLVHRDLKPENIFLQDVANGSVPKVLDFGVAKTLNQGQGTTDSITLGTAAGVLVGTLDYMAPEQAAGDDVSPSWDVWALSVVAFEMLTGRHPFRRGITLGMTQDPGEIATGHSAERTDLPERAQAFFREALSPDRTRRPPDSASFLAGIEQVLA